MTLKKAMGTVGLAVFGLFIWSAPASSQVAIKKGNVYFQEAELQSISKDMIAINFAEGGATVSQSDAENLAQFVGNTQSQGKVKRYIVAAWSDQNYPETGRLSAEQRQLAAHRAKQIKGLLRIEGTAKIVTYEMTKQPNWIQQAFGTEAVQIKKGSPNPRVNQRLSQNIGERLRSLGGPHKAVVAVVFKDEVLSH